MLIKQTGAAASARVDRHDLKTWRRKEERKSVGLTGGGRKRMANRGYVHNRYCAGTTLVREHLLPRSVLAKLH